MHVQNLLGYYQCAGGARKAIQSAWIHLSQQCCLCRQNWHYFWITVNYQTLLSELRNLQYMPHRFILCLWRTLLAHRSGDYHDHWQFVYLFVLGLNWVLFCFTFAIYTVFVGWQPAVSKVFVLCHDFPFCLQCYWRSTLSNCIKDDIISFRFSVLPHCEKCAEGPIKVIKSCSGVIDTF